MKFQFCIGLLALLSGPVLAKTACDVKGIWLQVLGSGGPELDDSRASTGYLLWQAGYARLIVDMGTGSLFRFEETGASINDLDVILLSHLHVDHSNDLPGLVKGTFFSDRDRHLDVYGPAGNRFMPPLTVFLKDLFWVDGAYQYLNRYLDGTDMYTLRGHDVAVNAKKLQTVMSNAKYQISAVPVHHGALPALAWRVAIGGKTVVFSGDMNNEYNTLAQLAMNADILVAHHAIPEGETGVARNLHMPPSVIGKIAATAKVKMLVLSHRMKRTLGQEQRSTELIRQSYTGPIQFANDLQCFKP